MEYVTAEKLGAYKLLRREFSLQLQSFHIMTPQSRGVVLEHGIIMISRILHRWYSGGSPVKGRRVDSQWRRVTLFSKLVQQQYVSLTMKDTIVIKPTFVTYNLWKTWDVLKLWSKPTFQRRPLSIVGIYNVLMMMTVRR